MRCTDNVSSLWHLVMEECADWTEEGAPRDNWGAHPSGGLGNESQDSGAFGGIVAGRCLGLRMLKLPLRAGLQKSCTHRGRSQQHGGYPATGCRVGMVMCALQHRFSSPCLHPRGAWELQVEPCMLCVSLLP